MMQKTRILLVALLMAVPAMAGCGAKATGETQETETGVPVRVHEVKRGDVEDVLEYSVDLKPEMEVKVFSMLSETILDFPWEDGDEIQKGQRVALVRTKGLSANIAQISAQTEGLDVQIDQAKDQLDRSRKLLASNTISQTEYDQIESGYKALLAQKKALKAGKSQVADTRSKGNIKAPISGIIADKSVEVGDMASPAMPLCRILSVDRLKAELDLVEADVKKVREGQNVHMKMDAYPDRTFEGQITTILPYLNAATRTNRVEVLVDNPVDPATGQHLLKPGMYGTAELVVESRQDVILAPQYALLMDSELLAQQEGTTLLRKAFVVQDGVARERIVTLGIRQGSFWEILDGLEVGDLLVTRGQHGLADGKKVEIVD